MLLDIVSSSAGSVLLWKVYGKGGMFIIRHGFCMMVLKTSIEFEGSYQAMCKQ